LVFKVSIFTLQDEHSQRNLKQPR